MGYFLRSLESKRELPLFFITAPFNNMQTLKFKAQPTNAFFAAVNQMFGGSSLLPTTAERSSYHQIVYSRQPGEA